MVDKINGSLPNMAPDGALGTEQKGLLSVIGDPVGKVLDTTLRPTVGAITGGVGNPTGDALLKVERVAKYEKGYTKEDLNLPDEEKPGGASIGGNKQTGQNPLGL